MHQGPADAQGDDDQRQGLRREGTASPRSDQALLRSGGGGLEVRLHPGTDGEVRFFPKLLEPKREICLVLSGRLLATSPVVLEIVVTGFSTYLNVQ